MYERLLKDIEVHDDYLVIGSQAEWIKLDETYFQYFIERRAKLNIKIRLLLQDSEIARKHKKFARNYNETIMILPKQTELTTNLIITPKRVVIHQLVAPILAIEIENMNVVYMNKQMFEIIWSSLSI